MTRTPNLTPEEMNPEQRRVYDEIYASRGVWLNGPFAPMLHQPKIADPAQKLGEFVRYNTSLEPELTELAVIAVARHHDSEFEWLQHSRIALKVGVSPEVVEAIRVGERPNGLNERSQLVYDFTIALLERNRVPDDLYAAATSAFGTVGVVELVAVIGYYTLIAFTLNAHEVSMPADAEPQLPDLGHAVRQPSPDRL
jgi:4-carboxymuconolactone decarboxylase